MLMYRTMSIRIKKGNRLYGYFDELTRKSANLYNATNFYVRQVFSGISKDASRRHANEQEAIEQVNACMAEHPRFREVTAESPYLSYGMLDYVFKTLRHEAYYDLPAQANQQVMQEVFEAWKSFNKATKDYRTSPEKYSGRPKPPGYAKKGSRKTLTLSNQICVVKEERYLKLPKTKHRLNIGKLGAMGRLQEVRVVPANGIFTVQLVLQVEADEAPTLSREHILGIDLGVNNFAAATNNVNKRPFILNGRTLKSINQRYNKERTRLTGILRHGQQPNSGAFRSKRLERLDLKRGDKIKDFMHKASRQVVDYCVREDIGTIVVGMNEGFKREVKLGKASKQSFMTISYSTFLDLLAYKCETAGIELKVTEESYTSKASFLDRDGLPVYGKETIELEFSGRRIKRGLYKSKNGSLINADCNGSGNIIRKVFPEAFGRGDRGVVDTPVVLSIA